MKFYRPVTLIEKTTLGTWEKMQKLSKKGGSIKIRMLYQHAHDSSITECLINSTVPPGRHITGLLSQNFLCRRKGRMGSSIAYVFPIVILVSGISWVMTAGRKTLSMAGKRGPLCGWKESHSLCLCEVGLNPLRDGWAQRVSWGLEMI